jgi:molybdopterin molybdotransferase/putative molybdopterin biosynthesis protein
MIMRNEFHTLLSLNEAQSMVLNRLPVAEEETISLNLAVKKVLAEKVVSEIDVPGFNRAIMDGFAVHSTDTYRAREEAPITLKLIGNITIGSIPGMNVALGEAVEISTGSVIPAGSDAVVMVEYCDAFNDKILIYRPVHAGENIQMAGSDIMLGETVLFPGTIITTRDIGVLAALGRHKIRVRKLGVGIVSTGNELVSLNTSLGPGQIFDINSYSLAAAILDCGGTPVKYGILPDDREKMKEALLKMSDECDIVLLSGSTSAGKSDYLSEIFDEIGELLFHGINLKPGKPTLFGFIDGTPTFGLPGYPTSALTVFSLLVAPAIRKTLGLKSKMSIFSGKLAIPIRSEGRQQMLAASVRGDWIFPVDKGSGSITTLSKADGIIEIPANVEYLEKGENLELQLFGELHEPDLVIAGENCSKLEMLAEKLPCNIRFLNNGKRGFISLEEGLADLACISCHGAEGINYSSKYFLVSEYVQKLGLMAKDEALLQTEDIACLTIIGWSKESEMNILLENSLKGLYVNIDELIFIGEARTHFAVAASVVSGKTDLGFGEQAVAESKNLAFRNLAVNKIELIASSSNLDKSALKLLVSHLDSNNNKRNFD